MLYQYNHRSWWRSHFFWIGLVVVVLVVIGIVFSVTISLVDTSKNTHHVSPIVTAPAPRDWSSFFAKTVVGAKAAYVVDLGTGQTLYSKNASEPLPLASLTKLMTTATALDLAPTTTIVAITHLAVIEGWGGDSGLYVDERWRLSDLLKFTLVVSSNDGATAIAQNVGAMLRNPNAIAQQLHFRTASSTALVVPNAANLVWSASTTDLESDQALFVEKMNELAGKLGLTSAHFYDPSGLDMSTTTAGGYASAQDVAKLLIYDATRYPTILGATRYPTITISSLNNLRHVGNNTDVLSLSGLNLIASKTGYTDLAGGNLAIITLIANHPVVIVVLGSTIPGRFQDVAALASTSATVIAAGG